MPRFIVNRSFFVGVIAIFVSWFLNVFVHLTVVNSIVTTVYLAIFGLIWMLLYVGHKINVCFSDQQITSVYANFVTTQLEKSTAFLLMTGTLLAAILPGPYGPVAFMIIMAVFAVSNLSSYKDDGVLSTILSLLVPITTFVIFWGSMHDATALSPAGIWIDQRGHLELQSVFLISIATVFASCVMNFRESKDFVRRRPGYLR